MLSAKPGSAFVLATVICILELPLQADPGFGTIRKKSITLEVRQPALVRLANTSIAFTGKSANPEYQTVLQSLLSTLETEIVSHEKTLIKKQDPKAAEWTLYLDVTGYSAPPPKQTSQNTNGTTVVTNHWNGSLNVAYQVLDTSGRVHDAGNISEIYTGAYPVGATKGASSFFGLRVPGANNNSDEPIPHTAEDVKQILVRRAVRQISSSLGNTSTSVSVRVAGGEDHLNRAGDFMEQRLWSRALDEVQALKPLSNPEHESYRLYTLGLIHEAMSYEAKVYKDQRANLMQAQEFYDKALGSNRGERYFVETVARLRDSIARYRSLDQQQAAERKNVNTRARTDPPAAPAPVQQVVAKVEPAAPPAPAKPKGNTASDIIKLHQAGIPKEQIFEIIRSAPLEFNPVDIPTVMAINESKLPIEIQNEMRKKVGANMLPVPEAPKPVRRTPTTKPATSKPAAAPAK
jgi:hypothetical protein